MAKKADIRTLDLDIAGQWEAFGGGAHIPYLGVAAHTDWAEKHPAETLALYKTYAAAAQWVASNPGCLPAGSPQGRAGRDARRAPFGQLDADPTPATIYAKDMQ